MRNFLFGSLIMSPVVLLGVWVYNPAERAATSRDEARKDTINIIARALEPEFKKNGLYPKDLSVLEFLPPGIDKLTYKVSGDGQDIIIYTEAESLSWAQNCRTETPFILYTSEGNRTAIVCAGSPTPGPQEFVN